ncbi:MAG: hypothetical protein Q9M43_11490 [Sulfurimonas sp.]|nr:hypothetical protein [Sulfurimonas sp.]
MDDAPKGLEYIGTPTFHFLDANKKKLYMISGGKRTKGFLEALDSVH